MNANDTLKILDEFGVHEGDTRRALAQALAKRDGDDTTLPPPAGTDLSEPHAKFHAKAEGLLG